MKNVKSMSSWTSGTKRGKVRFALRKVSLQFQHSFGGGHILFGIEIRPPPGRKFLATTSLSHLHLRLHLTLHLLHLLRKVSLRLALPSLWWRTYRKHNAMSKGIHLIIVVTHQADLAFADDLASVDMAAASWVVVLGIASWVVVLQKHNPMSKSI